MFVLMGDNVLCKIIFDDKKGCWKWNLGCTPVKVHNIETDKLIFGNEKELILSISDYFTLHSIISEKDSDESFTGFCHSWRVSYFDGNSIKITLLNPNEDLFRETMFKI